MAERKVLNKYYPPDFDPSKLPRRKIPKNNQQVIRNMLPMTIRCKTCGNFIYKGTKFNSRMEQVVGETYLGQKILRFYMKCTTCAAEITFKTDPQNSDYSVESGATRNFEPWRDEEAEERKQKREVEEFGDKLKSAENKALDSKREMDMDSALEEVRSIKSRHAKFSSESVLEGLRRRDEEAERKRRSKEEEEDSLYASLVFRNLKDNVRRVADEEDLDECGDNLKRQQELPSNLLAKPRVSGAPKLYTISVVKK
ncbi:hypothetical protein M0R45_014283 [Rubus argutus]|uniref:Splicing factor YJU2 n=1 Tax=Rubus argutus TaxID=59490 RepID=A0AAW1XNP0_RUBAR